MTKQPHLYQRNISATQRINFIIPWDGFDSLNWQSLILDHFDQNPLPCQIRVMHVLDSREPKALCQTEPLKNEHGDLIGRYLVGVVSDYDPHPIWIRSDKNYAHFRHDQLPEVIKRIYLNSLAKIASKKSYPREKG